MSEENFMGRRLKTVLALTGIIVISGGLSLVFDSMRQPAPDEIILFSLEWNFKPDQLSEDAELLHGYHVLGKTKIQNPESVKEIIAAVRNDLKASGVQANCFWPRHAIRVVDKTKTVDYVVCFHCGNYEMTIGDKLETQSRSMGRASRPIFNRYLKAANIPLSPGAEDTP